MCVCVFNKQKCASKKETLKMLKEIKTDAKEKSQFLNMRKCMDWMVVRCWPLGFEFSLHLASFIRPSFTICTHTHIRICIDIGRRAPKKNVWRVNN